jgi:hypothetical protein
LSKCKSSPHCRNRRRGRAIEVGLAGGRRLFVEPGFDPDHLRALVAALEAQA